MHRFFFQAGLLCAARWDEDQEHDPTTSSANNSLKFYRVIIEEVLDDNDAFVRQIDFGHADLVSSQDLFELPVDFATCAPFALSCTLDLKKRPSQRAEEAFKRIWEDPASNVYLSNALPPNNDQGKWTVLGVCARIVPRK